MGLIETEFAALRHTIAVRGTVRIVLLPATLLGWSLLAASVIVLGDFPLGGVLSLAVLVGGFEAIHALHVGVERIGRYLQVYYESSNGGPQWETVAMSVGPALPGGGIDPLFTVVFVGAAAINAFLVLLLEPTVVEIGVVLLLHALFITRAVRARIAAAQQRAIELESFRAIQARGSQQKG